MAQNNLFAMINIEEKNITRRLAIAKGRINMASATVEMIKNHLMPKGNVLAMAEVAGIMAAKNTPQILPLCHPLLLESVKVSCQCFFDSIEATCEVRCSGKTGVEMEALCGVNAALLCIYDMTKGVDPVLSISQIYLDLKEGGKSGRFTHPIYSIKDQNYSREKTNRIAEPTVSEDVGGVATNKELKKEPLSGVNAAVITISDRCSRGEANDLSGPVLKAELEKYGANIDSQYCVPDDQSKIQEAVLSAKEKGANLIVTTGGTGLGPKDVTPEAMKNLWTRTLPGFGELLRNEGANYTKKAYLSRAQAGLLDKTLVLLLPGSPSACKEGLEILIDLLPHALHIAEGRNHG